MTLADFIRDVALLKGTKIMCREGGCGCCVITAKVPDLVKLSSKTIAVNSVRLYHV
jgi:xanthine dehydrogenase/oxidase